MFFMENEENYPSIIIKYPPLSVPLVPANSADPDEMLQNVMSATLFASIHEFL